MSCISTSSFLCIPQPQTLLQKEKKSSPDELASLAWRIGSHKVYDNVWSSDQYMVASLSLLSLSLSLSVYLNTSSIAFCLHLDVLVALMTFMPAFYDLYLSSQTTVASEYPAFLPCMLSCLILLLCLHLIELVSLTTAVFPLVFFFHVFSC